MMMHESVERVLRENLYLQIANRLQLHYEDRIVDEGPPTVKDIAKHYMGKFGTRDNMLPVPDDDFVERCNERDMEFVEWYYGQDREPKAWCKDIVTPIELFDPYEPFPKMPWVPNLPIYKGFKSGE